jgi:KUP system potassium uptake protein
MVHSSLNKVSAAGLLITLGIIYGDIGTSPLYVMTAIAGQSPISELMVLGSISAVFWTLTLQTTVKYVLLTGVKVVSSLCTPFSNADSLT